MVAMRTEMAITTTVVTVIIKAEVTVIIMAEVMVITMTIVSRPYPLGLPSLLGQPYLPGRLRLFKVKRGYLQMHLSLPPLILQKTQRRLR